MPKADSTKKDEGGMMYDEGSPPASLDQPPQSKTPAASQKPNSPGVRPIWRIMERAVPMGSSFRGCGTITMRPVERSFTCSGYPSEKQTGSRAAPKCG